MCLQMMVYNKRIIFLSIEIFRFCVIFKVFVGAEKYLIVSSLYSLTKKTADIPNLSSVTVFNIKHMASTCKSKKAYPQNRYSKTFQGQIYLLRLIECTSNDTFCEVLYKFADLFNN